MYSRSLQSKPPWCTQDSTPHCALVKQCAPTQSQSAVAEAGDALYGPPLHHVRPQPRWAVLGLGPQALPDDGVKNGVVDLVCQGLLIMRCTDAVEVRMLFL